MKGSIQKYKKPLLFSAIVVLVLIFGLFAWFQYNKARLFITSEPGATISIATERGGAFRELGVESARFSTDSAKTVYIKVQKDGKITIQSITLEKRKEVTINVQLKETRNPERIAEGPLAFPLVQDRFVYGVNPNTGSLDYRSIRGNETTNFAYLEIPSIKNIGWFDENNFIYTTFFAESGFVVNGERRSDVVIGDDTPLDIIDFSRYKDGPLVLLTDIGITTQSDLSGKNLRLIARPELNGSPRIFSDDKNIYFVRLLYDQVEDEGDVPSPLGTELKIFDYEGSLKTDITIGAKTETKQLISLSDDRLALLTSEGLLFVNKGSGITNSTPLYFMGVNDLTKINQNLYILTNMGLWQHDKSTGALYLVAPLDEGEEYVPNSLSIYSNGKGVYYSAQPKEEELLKNAQAASGGIYRLDF